MIEANKIIGSLKDLGRKYPEHAERAAGASDMVLAVCRTGETTWSPMDGEVAAVDTSKELDAHSVALLLINAQI